MEKDYYQPDNSTESFCLRTGLIAFLETTFGPQPTIGVQSMEKERVKENLNIEEISGPQNEVRKQNFPATIQYGSLEIQFFWTGSLYNPLPVNGPLISAVAVTRDRRKNFTLKQIIDATKKFSPRTELGRGRSGILYKAELPDLNVAVKKLFSQSKAVDEIASEVHAKKALVSKHENLVQLLATYSRRNLYLLIYENMELGSLGKVLFDPNSTVQLDWPKRFTICLGIAKGLLYLHESSYMAPEYATRGAITVKVDVYSFGILLLETFSGKNNADYSGNQEYVFLLETAGKSYARGRLAELVDARMVRYNWDQVNTILTLAIMRVDLSPSIRRTMSQILSVLEGEKSFEEISREVNNLSMIFSLS
ncbi:unnamed protein product [Dovyalis caffra]|uniref:Protein kinase domain-containing protein n=1 Tax=Dovyalis caffra TaxID=77055 RepID=A0AAV1RGE6_9ROSI|nr:unnamed protein product [Dovyalis caffra]